MNSRKRKATFVILGTLGVIGVAIAAALVLPRGSTDVLPEEPTELAALGEVEADVYQLFTAAGASSTEARCLSSPLAEGAGDISEVFENLPVTGDENESFESAADAVNARAPGCASLKRIQKVLRGVEEEENRKLEQSWEMLRSEAATHYRNSGATEEEIACIVDIVVGPPGGPSLDPLEEGSLKESASEEDFFAGAEEADRIMGEELLRCASQERLQQLGAAPYSFHD